jgi:hypothetical protein
LNVARTRCARRGHASRAGAGPRRREARPREAARGQGRAWPREGAWGGGEEEEEEGEREREEGAHHRDPNSGDYRLQNLGHHGERGRGGGEREVAAREN